MTAPAAAAAAATSDDLTRRALAAARETRCLEIAGGLLQAVPAIFQTQFGHRPAAIIADANTFPAAGRAVQAAFQSAGHPTIQPFIFTDPDLYAQYKFIEQLRPWLSGHDAIPIAVGSGTINDLVKLAAHDAGRQYLAVATAASMDGYTAFGASITHKGSKQTFDCPAPQAVVADLGVIAAAPPAMNAAGYADLLAKITAGADWICADALGIEPIDQTAWDLVQVPLRDALADPAGVRRGDQGALAKLTRGLMMGGFAMQWTKTSRPASGAEHQFSHLWDMQRHTHQGRVPSHGFKVAVGTIAIAELYQRILKLPLDQLDVNAAVAAWPDSATIEKTIITLLGQGELADKARLETSAKSIAPAALRDRLTRLRQTWPTLRQRLTDHLPTVADLRNMLKTAGAPTQPQDIGITPARLRESFHQAYLIRRRFTVLDLAAQTGIFDECLNDVFRQVH